MNVLIGTLLLWALALALLWRLHARTPDRLPDVLRHARATTIFMIPRVLVGLVGAAFLAELLPVHQIERFFGTQSGLAGVALAAVFGMGTPGGPFVAFAIGAAALKAGAGWAPLMAYVTAWSVMNLNRTIAYELPLMGRHFMLVRSVASLPVPLILGALVLFF